MKKLMLTAAGSLSLMSNISAQTAFTVNVKESNVVWTGKKVAGQHTGNLSLANGSVTVANGKVTGTALTLDMNSITCTDLTDEGYNQKLVGHLRSEDFFGVEKHPTVKFESTGFEAIAAAKEGQNNYTVKGKLTIKGITNEISFPARVVIKDGKLTANGTASFDRTKWDIKYGSGSFFDGLGDKMIYNDIELSFTLVAKG